MATLKYHEVVTALTAFDGEEHSSECQQYLNSIAGDYVQVPGGPLIRASQARKFAQKYADRLSISDALTENPARKLTVESVVPASRGQATTALATTAANILSDLRSLSGQALADYKSRLGGTTVTMYDLYGNACVVRAADMVAYATKDFAVAYPTLAITGTAITGGVTEAQIATGGETLIYTLTNGTWAASGTVFNALRSAFLAILRAAASPANGFNVEVVAGMAVGDVVRTSDTVVTITLPAAAGYSVAADEIVTLGVPANSVVNNEGGTIKIASGGLGVVPVPSTFTITAS